MFRIQNLRYRIRSVPGHCKPHSKGLSITPHFSRGPVMSICKPTRKWSFLLPLLAGMGAVWADSKYRRPNHCEEGTEESNLVASSAALTKIIHIHDVLDPTDFENVINGAESKYPGLPVFVLFTAEKCNGVSWCGDSNRAEPILVSTMEKYRPDCVLIVVYVRRSEYRSSMYSYRTNPKVKLKSVPTLQRS